MAEVPEAAVDAAFDADMEHHRRARQMVLVAPSREQIRVMLEAAAPIIIEYAVATERERGEALRAELRSVIDGFFAYYGNSSAPFLEKARDLAEGIRQVLDRDKISDEEEAGA